MIIMLIINISAHGFRVLADDIADAPSKSFGKLDCDLQSPDDCKALLSQLARAARIDSARALESTDWRKWITCADNEIQVRALDSLISICRSTPLPDQLLLETAGLLDRPEATADFRYRAFRLLAAKPHIAARAIRGRLAHGDRFEQVYAVAILSLAKIAQGNEEKRFYECLAANNSQDRILALHACSWKSALPNDALINVRTNLNHPNRVVRVVAASVTALWRNSGVDRSECLTVLVDSARDEAGGDQVLFYPVGASDWSSDNVQSYSILTLGQIGVATPEVLACLEHCIVDCSVPYNMYAVHSCSLLSNNSTEAALMYRRAMFHKTFEVREAAIKAAEKMNIAPLK